MNRLSKKRLFWFLKENMQLDLSDSSQMDMYVQQVITHGNTKDVSMLLKEVDFTSLKESIKRLVPFIPFEVGKFWEHLIGNNK